MRYVILVLMFLLSLVLPGTIFYFWSWAGIKPDLVMLFVIYVSIHHHRLSTGALWGFGAGILEDLYLGRYLGMYALTLTVVGLFSGWLVKRWYRENFFLTMLLVFTATVIGELLIAFLSIGAGLEWQLQDILRVVLGTAIYNTILVPLTYPLIHRSFTQGWLRYRPKYER